tara:strand:+ start:114 stop:320 length:207 start_codon:yes stop_codon:yes gene_type:complete
MRLDSASRFLEHSYGLVSLNRWKLMKKLLERVTAFDVVEQRLNRNSSPLEDGRSSEDIWINDDMLNCS